MALLYYLNYPIQYLQIGFIIINFEFDFRFNLDLKIFDEFIIDLNFLKIVLEFYLKIFSRLNFKFAISITRINFTIFKFAKYMVFDNYSYFIVIMYIQKDFEKIKRA